ncbi:hypothetical protein ACWEWI_28420 [Streptomyces sp. NPDC003753]|uniref:hypothetical protein n=1 Tax=unclassified Streptomyces TaxID=2593676 RepID=UPI00190761E3|nr:hypothetical protein [Streptomyces sp. Y2F8-2]GHK03974.1 hypothetical protein SY2F82_57710 [Streptomyces sp. Y2F8-2]
MINGYVIGESLRTGAVFEPEGLRIRKVSRIDVSGSARDGQPSTWTFVEFETDDSQATALSQALAEALEPDMGWYSDFVVGDDRVVVFAGKVFRYRRGDAHGRAEAVAYGRSVGTPEDQLDWKE